jgi:hypothetical protein
VKVTHSIVYAHSERYAGWPANHGAWQWGNEFLVGFLEGPYQPYGMHFIGQPWHKRFARSLDGGRLWVVEPVGEQFFTKKVNLSPLPEEVQFDGDWALRFCGQYDHGGDSGARGGVYASPDRGKTWKGPYSFDGASPRQKGDYSSTRTAYLPSGLVFVSVACRNEWGKDQVACARRDGHLFSFLSWVGDHERARCVMPAVAQIGDRILVALRRKSFGESEGWVDLWQSKDGGHHWEPTLRLGETGGNNGNPPAILALDDQRVICAWGDRTNGCMMARLSMDGGQTFESEFAIRDDAWCENDYLDFGYPRLLLRADGVPVCLYYWADRERPQQHIVATAIDLEGALAA